MILLARCSWRRPTSLPRSSPARWSAVLARWLFVAISTAAVAHGCHPGGHGDEDLLLPNLLSGLLTAPSSPAPVNSSETPIDSSESLIDFSEK